MCVCVCEMSYIHCVVYIHIVSLCVCLVCNTISLSYTGFTCCHVYSKCFFPQQLFVFRQCCIYIVFVYIFTHIKVYVYIYLDSVVGL